MRVCHFTETLPGGPATYLNELVPLQQKRYGHDNVYVAAPRHQLQHLNISATQLIPLDYPKRNIYNLASLWRQWRNIAETHNFDVTHLHSTLAGFIGRTIPSRIRNSVVYCSHGWSFSMNQSNIVNSAYAAGERILSNRASKIILISKAELESAEQAGIPLNRCQLVRNGIDEAISAVSVTRPASPAEGCIKLLFVGRFDHQKGFDLLLEAMSKLPRHEFDLTAIGGYVVSKETHHELRENITLAGWRSPQEIRESFAQCDAVVMPSRWEGFGLVAVEAMRAGVPVVASRVGGLSEIVIHNDTGLLCAPGEVDDLVNKLLSLRSADLRAMGHRGYDRFRNYFTSERMEREIHNVYDDIVTSITQSENKLAPLIGE